MDECLKLEKSHNQFRKKLANLLASYLN